MKKIKLTRCLVVKRTFTGFVKLDWGRSKGFRIGYRYGYIDILTKKADPSYPTIEFCIPRYDATDSIYLN